MSLKNKILITTMGVIASTSAIAGVSDKEAFWYDSNNVVVTDGQGNCLRTQLWTQENGICPTPPVKPVVKQEPVKIVEKQVITISVHNSKLFKTNEYKIKTDSLYSSGLDSLTQKIKETGEIKSVVINGHTDSTGSKGYNQKLSEKRANSVKQALIERGINPNLIIAVGYGENLPMADNKTKEGREFNRRVDLAILVEKK